MVLPAVQVVPMVTETVAVCVISAGMKNRSESPLVPIRKQPLVDRDLVMTKWLGLEGTAVMAADSRGKLCGRYPSDLVDTAADFYKYLSPPDMPAQPCGHPCQMQTPALTECRRSLRFLPKRRSLPPALRHLPSFLLSPSAHRRSLSVFRIS